MYVFLYFLGRWYTLHRNNTMRLYYHFFVHITSGLVPTQKKSTPYIKPTKRTWSARMEGWKLKVIWDHSNHQTATAINIAILSLYILWCDWQLVRMSDIISLVVRTWKRNIASLKTKNKLNAWWCHYKWRFEWSIHGTSYKYNHIYIYCTYIHIHV